MAEEKTYQSIHPNRAIAKYDGVIKFDRYGRFTTDDEEEQDIIEGHSWFGGIITEAKPDPALPPQVKIEYDDEAALARAHAVADRIKKPEAVSGMAGTDLKPIQKDELIHNPAMADPTVPPPELKVSPTPEAEPEVVEYPARNAINLMSRDALGDVIDQYNLDVDKNLGYNVLKAAVKHGVEKRVLGME